MTDTIPLAELGGDNVRRDQWGRYLVVPPGGGRPTGYTRVTTVAKALDGGGGLAAWKASMAAAGIIMRRGLRARWEALLALYAGDPWYASEASKAECKALVEDCAAVGGANDRREVGSALHAITALADSGRALPHLTEETERDLEAYHRGLAAAGITIVGGQIEQIVVLDEYQVAGTFDRLATVPGFELPLIADLKTGASLDYSWQPFAVQLAAYAHGDAIYVQGPAADGSKDQRLAMPPVDQDFGLVFWLNAGSGAFEIYLVDLRSGWEGFTHSMWARGWHNAKPASLYVPGVPRPSARSSRSGGDLVPLLEASIAQAQRDRAPSLRDWLQGRINVIGEHPEARVDLGSRWPADMPTLRASQAHTPHQLELIEGLLDGVERRWEIRFPPPKPEEQAVAKVLDMFPGSTITNTKEPA